MKLPAANREAVFRGGEVAKNGSPFPSLATVHSLRELSTTYIDNSKYFLVGC